jgi:multiple sugar transport system ATP-binding protein
MVFQNYALYPHMTVDRNMAFSLRIRRVPKSDIRSQVAETAHVLDLEPLLDRKPAALSGGQRQRVAMGRAIVRHPQVFLMDEPLSNLDAKLRVAMRGQLSRLHQRYATTTIYVTHDQIEAMTLGDRIAVLERGRLQQVGSPDELYAAPRNIFVAGFIGSPAMNLSRARIETGTGGLTLVVGDYHWPLPQRELARRPSLREYTGREVVFGLRPGNLSLAVDAAPDAPRLTVEAATVESLGSEKNLLFVPPLGQAAQLVAAGEAGGDEAGDLWTARVSQFAPVRTAERVDLAVDLTGIHFFDPDTTDAIPVGHEPAIAVAGTKGTVVPGGRD